MKFTPWFHAFEKPVRPGYYAVQFGGSGKHHRFQWTGSYWRDEFGRIQLFMAFGDRWRGLAKKP